MGLVSRLLESNGIATLVIGSALDIIEHCGVPRYVHSDLPLGNPCGVPDDREMQRAILNQSLEFLSQAEKANSVYRTDATWPTDFNWRDDYSKVDDSNRESLRLKGEARRAQQAAEKAAGNTRASMIVG